MSISNLLGEASRLGWRTSIAVVSGNVRLYGWVATLKKLARRLDGNSNIYRSYIERMERLQIDVVDKSTDIFSRPCILIIGALDLPQCRKYRVLQKLEFFESIAWECHYARYLDESRVLGYLQISTALILYRVPDSSLLDDYLSEAKRLGVKIFYDIDDPIFNGAVYSENKNLDHIEPHEREHLLNSAGDYREAMKKADALILSTNYLKEIALSDFEKPAFLWRNLADSATISMVKSLEWRQVCNDSGSVVIGYASGSRAHDEDFRVISTALVRIFNEYEDVKLRVIGHVVVPSELEVFKHRIIRQPFSSYLQYLEALSQADINIVPLIDDRFNACKSAIRYIEASLCRVPTVASSVGQFSEIIINGKDGYLTDTQQSWVDALGRLIENKELRKSVGDEAYDNVMSCHTVSAPGAIDQDIINQFVLSNEE